VNRYAIVVVLCFGAAVLASGPGEQSRAQDPTTTPTPDWQATAHWAQSWADTYREGLLRCLYVRATDYAVATRHPCARGDELYLPRVTQ
jgi:hypothetical protein